MNDAQTPADSACTLPYASAAPTDPLAYEVCVVGGGMAGLCAALAAARGGARTALIQDRPVLGGNASSEVRMWICGAHGPDNKETGYLEELQLANLRLNPRLSYSVWDTVLYGAARMQPNLDLYLNCAVCEVRMESPARIAGVRAWHLTRHRWLDVGARAFIDCSGDSILRLGGAPCRWGREARAATGESKARAVADRRTMGNTILIQLREIPPGAHRPFVPPAWALPVDAATFPHREGKMTPTGHNFWWLELGGMHDSLADGDQLRDRLLALAYGVWAYIKNHPDGRGHAWELEWIGSLPGKRENVRYEGDHTLTQTEIDGRGRFPDVIAHGGWTMDDHPPAGIEHSGTDTTHHPAPSPYGIPYRCLYSRTVENLWFAGRNISATHMALSSTRVMATCALLGQAAGTAAAIAIAHGCDNRGVFARHLDRLQRRLMDQDQWLPGRLRPIAPDSVPGVARYTASRGDPDVLRDGFDRPQDDDSHRWEGRAGDWIAAHWEQPRPIARVRLVGDSRLDDVKRMPCSYPLAGHAVAMPAPLPRDLRLERLTGDGRWETVARVTDNTRRCVIWELAEPVTAPGLRVVLERAWGDAPDQAIGLFALEFGDPAPTGPIVEVAWPEPFQWNKRRR